MATPRETLKYYFRKYALPTEQQFAELIDAFVHKDEDMLTQEKIDGLTADLQSKVSTETLEQYKAEVQAMIDNATTGGSNISERLDTAEDNIAGHETRIQALESAQGGSADITVDAELSTESENPVQNKVIASALQSKANNTDLQNLQSLVESFLNDADASEATINKWKELESFLSGITDQETLSGLLAALKEEIIALIPEPQQGNFVKQITDLDTYEGTTGEIVQYIGTTTPSFTRGFFYERKEGEGGITREYTLLGEAYQRGNVSSYNHGIDAEVYNRISEWLPDQAFNSYEYQKCYRTGETVRGYFSKYTIDLAGQYKVGGILAGGSGAFKIAEIVTEDGWVKYKDQDGSVWLSISEEYIDPATGEYKDEYNVDANVYATPSGKKFVFFEDSTTFLAMALDDDLTPLFAFQIAFPVDGYQLYTEEDSTPTPASWQVIPTGPCVG